MENLGKYLDTLRELNDYRDRAKELREQGLRPLRTIKDITCGKKVEILTKTTAHFQGKPEIPFSFEKWTASGNIVEIALVAKLQSHRDICEKDDDNNTANADALLKNRLTNITLRQDLMPIEDDNSSNLDSVKSVPVLAAARTMQVLVGRSETTLSRASMICYYRILRELYGTAPSDWTVGAARAGTGGTTSAFVTGECIRALFAFRDTLQRTATFFRETEKLLEEYSYLRVMAASLGKTNRKKHPLYVWADKTMGAIWLDWFLSTNLRRGQISLFYNEKYEKNDTQSAKKFNDVSNNLPNSLFQFKYRDEEIIVGIETISKYFQTFIENLSQALNEARLKLQKAIKEIEDYRTLEETLLEEAEAKQDYKLIKERKDRIQRSASAHLFALQSTEDAYRQILKAQEIIKENKDKFEKDKKACATLEKKEELEIEFQKTVLNQIANLCEDNARHLNKIAAPTKQYIKGVLRRELSNNPSMFDAGELVFAATTFGAMTDWKQHELLNRACELLVNALPESGRLATKRPLHTSNRGYRLLPIGCEMTRSLAQLFENMHFEFDSQIVGRMLSIFEEKLIPLDEGSEKNDCIGWNFDSSPDPESPCVWVSSVSVLALDRLIRMLNARINKAVYKHFEIIKPEKPHIKLPINELIYGDYGFYEYFYPAFKNHSDLKPIPIQIELMRSHLMRASLPRPYTENSDGRIYSSILYGPPGTGKTTIAEVLAYNSKRPLIKLSPSDLIVQGEEFIEGRARDMFEALSMLTQTVIIFDEFEPMVKTRKHKDVTKKNLEQKEREQEVTMTGILKIFEEIKERYSNTNFNEIREFARQIVETNKNLSDFDNISLKNIADELREIRKKDDPRVRFLLAGMLPKFLKLHDAAKDQSLVYFLGTNVLKDIDLAAQRSGRFDVKIPIYNPCPLSRAGTFLYRLSKKAGKIGKLNLYEDEPQLKNFLEVIVATANESASELAQKYFNVRKPSNFEYVIEKKGDYQPNVEKKEKHQSVAETNKLQELVKEVEEIDENLEDIEKKQYNWLIEFEHKIKESLDELDTVGKDKLINFLIQSLEFKPNLSNTEK